MAAQDPIKLRQYNSKYHLQDKYAMNDVNQPLSVLIGGVGPIFWTFQKRYPAEMTGLNSPSV